MRNKKNKKIKKKFVKSKKTKKKIINPKKRKKKRISKRFKKRNIKKSSKKKIFKIKSIKQNKLTKTSPPGIILKLIRLQNKLKNKFTINLSFDFFKIDKAILSFFQKIDNKFLEYKNLKADENRRIKLEKLLEEKREKEKNELEKKANEERL